jgi:hypothetical protein
VNPILFDVSAYSAVARSPDKTQVTDAVEFFSLPIIVRVINGDYLPFNSEMIQSVRCILTAKRQFGDFDVRVLVGPSIGALITNQRISTFTASLEKSRENSACNKDQ